MTTDLFRSIRAEDGFAADPDDFNEAQRTGMARLFDQILAKLIPNVTDTEPDTDGNGPNVPTGPWAYALKSGGARPIQGSTNAKIKISAGTLFQKLAAADGLAAQLVPYTFDGTDEVTIANGDVANPRVDIVQMKLERLDDTPTTRDFEDAVTRAKTSPTTNLYHRIKCTLSVKQGAPAASPTYPAPDAGCVVIAGVVVGTNYVAAAGLKFVDTAGAVAVLHDQRMPLGTRPHHVTPRGMLYTGADWTYPTTAAYIAFVGGGGLTTPLYAPCPIGGGGGRLIAVGTLTHNCNGATFAMFRTSLGDDGAGGISNVFTAINGTNITPASNDASRRITPRSVIEFLHTPAAGPTVQSNANGMGAPLWTSGARCPLPSAFEAVPIHLPGLALALTAKGGAQPNIGPVTYWIAEGI